MKISRCICDICGKEVSIEEYNTVEIKVTDSNNKELSNRSKDSCRTCLVNMGIASPIYHLDARYIQNIIQNLYSKFTSIVRNFNTNNNFKE